MTEKKNGLVLWDNIIKLANSDDAVAGMDKALALCEHIVKAKMFSHIESAEQVFSAILLADELGIPPMQCLSMSNKFDKNAIFAIQRGKELGIPAFAALDNIYPYEKDGKTKTIIGVHVLKGILLKNKVTYHTVENYKPLHIYQSAKEGKITGNYYEENIIDFKFDSETGEYNYQVKPGYQIIIPGVTSKEDVDPNKIAIFNTNQEYNRRTLIIGKRVFDDDKVMHSYSFYTRNLAAAAGLSDKTNWKAYEKDMIEARAFGNLARYLASDLIQGSYVVGEIPEAAPNIVDVDYTEEIN